MEHQVAVVGCFLTLRENNFKNIQLQKWAKLIYTFPGILLFTFKLCLLCN